MKVKKLISGAAGIAGCIAGGMAAAAAVNKALARQEIGRASCRERVFLRV